jgi:shikimate kinase/3-dehydroquinate synthase
MSRRPVALVGFMGAGKSTIGALLAGRRGVPFADVDAVIEAEAGRTVPEIFAADGEQAFRARERETIARLLRSGDAGVLALGGGALGDPATRALLAERADVVWLDVDADTAWQRVQPERAQRPLAADEARFRALHAERRALYEQADAVVDAALPPEVVAEACQHAPVVRSGALARLPGVAGDRRAVLVVDEAVAGRVPGGWAAVLAVRGGEEAKSVAAAERLWRAFAAAELERRDLVVAAGGGTVTDAAGFAAATFRRGVAWVAAPTTLVGQVDAAIGGKTAINVAAKNDVGAFHLPETVIADPDELETLPPREWAAGFAEVVKTALLAGGPLQELVAGWPPGAGERAARARLVRRCAAYKARIVAEDPTERGLRAVLNLGHTVGHGVEAAAGYGGLLHGEAVAVGLSAALWLSVRLAGLDPAVLDETEALLRRHGLPIRAPGVDAAAVHAAMRGDKKRAAGRPRMVLLEAGGRGGPAGLRGRPRRRPARRGGRAGRRPVLIVATG